MNGPCVLSLELPPQVKSGVFFFLFLCLSEGLSSSFLAVFFTSIPKWGILDYIAQGPITGTWSRAWRGGVDIGLCA